MTKPLFLSICLVLSAAVLCAQETGAYHIISISGSIKDQKTGKELAIGHRVDLQTLVEFGSLYDKAVLLSPAKVKFFLEPPASSFVNRQLTVSSTLALKQVKSRPQLATGIRGSAALKSEGVSQKTLGDYFGTDTFTIIGNALKLPVSQKDARKYDLIIRYENNGVEEYIMPGFEISKKALNISGNTIKECYILLKERNKIIPVTQITLSFLDKKRLFDEFGALLAALDETPGHSTARHTVSRYCNDVYGVVDRAVLEQTVNQFLKQ